MSTETVLDNVADAASATVLTRTTDVLVWVTGGSCNVAFGGATITTLAVGDAKVVTVGPNSELTFTASAGSTTAKIKMINPST